MASKNLINPKAITANEKLLAKLDREGIKVDRKQIRIMNNLREGKISADEALTLLVGLGYQLSSSAAKEMSQAILIAVESKKEYTKFAKVKGGLVRHRANQIVNGGSGLISTAGKDLALEQVRATIVQETPIAQGYIRVANAGACEFCRNLDGVRVNSDAIEMHYGCGCTIVPVLPRF